MASAGTVVVTAWEAGVLVGAAGMVGANVAVGASAGFGVAGAIAGVVGRVVVLLAAGVGVNRI